MKKVAFTSLALIVAAVCAYLIFHDGAKRKFRSNDDDACVRASAQAYDAHFRDQLRELQSFLLQLSTRVSPPASGAHVVFRESIQASRPPAKFHPSEVPGVNGHRREFACLFPPMALSGSQIVPYPLPIAPNCTQEVIKFDHLPNEDLLLTMSNSVGKLQVLSPANDDGYNSTFWGTSFVIANRVLATTCHTMDPLMAYQNGQPVLDLGSGEQLVVDFDNPTRRCVVSSILGCSTHLGLDVALLKIDDQSCMTQGDVPPSLPLYNGRPDILEQRPILAVVGYGDLDHPIDADTDDLYSPFKSMSYDKFLMLDFIPTTDKCDATLEVLLDAASTTVGESGAILVDFSPPSGEPLTVAGMHTCCATFFEREKAAPPQLDAPCARVRRTFDNQDIATQSIISDPTLCSVLKANGAIPQVNCPKNSP